MPETNSVPATGDDTQETTASSDTDELGEAGQRALARERAARKEAERLARQLQAKVKEFEDRGKSDLDKANERATEAEKRAEKAEADVLRYEVAIAKGLTLKQAKRLVGSTKEELEADADDILEAFGVKPPAGSAGGASEQGEQGGQQGEAGGERRSRPPSQRPILNLQGGSDPTREPVEMDPHKLAAQIPRL